MKSLLAVLLLCLTVSAASAGDPPYGAPPDNLAGYLERLKNAYPDVIADYDKAKLTLRSGATIPMSDGRIDKSFEELLDSPDVDDMFAFPYPAHVKPEAPGLNVDPGRIRVEALFRALYGDCRKSEADLQMRKVSWFGGTVRITTRQGVDRALEAVARDLAKLPKPMQKYLSPSAGTYNCRAIAGTDRLSMHAYGASIDLNTDFADYWRWRKPGKDGKIAWANRIPSEIVEVFERHGFIWGGRWYHYDTMHFEYRPELLTR
ncbi:MAG: M15 family metallopeptidase [Pseudomonadota bacterium]